ncbi:MAG: GNAT family N-acetyltransferase [Armatimonadetes bacterium]|nr:GNAT family N-acetyltransferase [Akkermansiaceae bacterium]
MIAIENKSGYLVRAAQTRQDIKAAQRLRYEIFNLELGEGLQSSHHTGLDSDPFDTHCDHLIIEETATGNTVGTYRLQTGEMAAKGLGYYSAQEFDFTTYSPFRAQILELGRACIHQSHRKRSVLDLLWRGIATYAMEKNSRYLLGCSSLTSQNPDEGWALYHQLCPKHLADAPFRTNPLPAYQLPSASGNYIAIKAPKLFATYLHIGATIAGPPALDREFQTIDFLTILDLHAMRAAGKLHFLKD